MDKPRPLAPLLVAILLVLPLLYLGSYFALVVPRGIFVWETPSVAFAASGRRVYYRRYDAAASVVFWPVEQLDRRVRPKEWVDRGMTVNGFLAQPRVAP